MSCGRVANSNGCVSSATKGKSNENSPCGPTVSKKCSAPFLPLTVAPCELVHLPTQVTLWPIQALPSLVASAHMASAGGSGFAFFVAGLVVAPAGLVARGLSLASGCVEGWPVIG